MGEARLGSGVVVVEDDDPVTVAARVVPRSRVLREAPADEPYDLRGLDVVWPVVVTDAEQCASVLDAVTRGATVVVRVDGLGADEAARFRDDLQRAAGASGGGVDAADPARLLTDEHREILEALAGGATVAAAARSLGLAPRSASRRLAEVRRLLGVESTAEAVMLVHGNP